MTMLAPTPTASEPTWQCVFEPAIARLGEALVARRLARTVQALRAPLAQRLAHLIGRPVQIAAADAQGAAWVSVWGVELAVAEGAVRVWLDATAARAIVDALALDAGGHLASGALSHVELGLLDYALVRLLADSQPAAATTVTVRGTLDASAPALDGSVALVCALHIGHHMGHVRVELPTTLGSTALPLPTPLLEPTRTLTVGACFAAGTIAIADWRAAGPGDVLLLAGDACPQVGAHCELVSHTGWVLAAAEVRSAGPRALQLACGELAPRVLAADDDCDARTLRVLAGVRQLSAHQLATFAPGHLLELSLADGGHLAAYANGELRPAELVRSGDEVGLRLLGGGR